MGVLKWIGITAAAAFVTMLFIYAFKFIFVEKINVPVISDIVAKV